MTEGQGKVWIEGRVVDAADARISVFDRGFLYGDSLFETFTTRGGRGTRALHLARLRLGAAAIGIDLPEGIDGALDATLDALDEPRVWIRVVLTRGGDWRSIGVLPSLRTVARLVILARRLDPFPAAIYDAGIAAVRIVAARPLPNVKSSSYLVSVLARAEAAKRGADEALLIDGLGHLLEGATSNALLVKDGLVSTPTTTAILAGVTRGQLLAIAARLGLGASESEIDRATLEEADEVLLSSSVRGVVPVVTIDGVPVGLGRPGPIFARLRTGYEALLDALERAT